MVSAEKRVLVVDDEQIVRESCKHVLTDAGYVVRTVASGRDALKACRTESFDMMLTDLKMPDMDGLEVVRAVVKEFPEVRTVIITGYPSPESAEQGEKLGIFDYLQKPLSPERLSEAAAAVLARPARRTGPAAEVATSAAAESSKIEEAACRPAPDLHATSTNHKVKLMVVGAVGFLVGVVVAYIIAPSQALAYLAVGTAIASGTILGLFSDAASAKSVKTKLQNQGHAGAQHAAPGA